jgi:hypothetical protein
MLPSAAMFVFNKLRFAIFFACPTSEVEAIVK